MAARPGRGGRSALPTIAHVPRPGPAPRPAGDPDLAPPRTPVAVASLAVLCGGFLGGLAREGVAVLWPGGALPWAVLAVNVVGAFVLAAVVEVVGVRMLQTNPVLAVRLTRPLLGTGFCGAFTTFSSLAVALDLDLRDGRPVAAVLYLLLSLTLGVAAAGLGSVTARRVAGP